MPVKTFQSVSLSVVVVFALTSQVRNQLTFLATEEVQAGTITKPHQPPLPEVTHLPCEALGTLVGVFIVLRL